MPRANTTCRIKSDQEGARRPYKKREPVKRGPYKKHNVSDAVSEVTANRKTPVPSCKDITKATIAGVIFEGPDAKTALAVLFTEIDIAAGDLIANINKAATKAKTEIINEVRTHQPVTSFSVAEAKTTVGARYELETEKQFIDSDPEFFKFIDSLDVPDFSESILI